MWIVAIGWSYVVILMAATETSFIAGMMTFLVYCMIPLSVLFYITGGKRRQARRAARAAAAPATPADAVASLPPPSATVAKNAHPAAHGGVDGACPGGSDGGCGGE